MKKFFYLIPLFLTILTFTGCSKDSVNNSNTAPGGKNMKFTITTSGLQAADADNFSIGIGGIPASSGATTLFKINGVVQNNETDISITKAQLMAGTVVVETTTPLSEGLVDVSGFTVTAGHSFSYKLQTEVGGVAQPDQGATITKDAVYSHDFTFLGK